MDKSLGSDWILLVRLAFPTADQSSAVTFPWCPLCSCTQVHAAKSHTFIFLSSPIENKLYQWNTYSQKIISYWHCNLLVFNIKCLLLYVIYVSIHKICNLVRCRLSKVGSVHFPYTDFGRSRCLKRLLRVLAGTYPVTPLVRVVDTVATLSRDTHRRY